ncbi:hypothetical protein AeMF1_003979 [Aphanomyces euteiches]|nr:hypothetical protein AeMF1_003979 [Aphanomyces euteiches]KAH9181931.1 hypothetical protein AeNC1_016093 [Aphanomyces euteiches]
MAEVDTWRSSLVNLLHGYSLADVFNCDETGLFWRGLPRKTLAFKSDPCTGGKLAKERVSVLLTCSALGEKLLLLVIGKSLQPRAFKKKAPCRTKLQWYANKKAWMTGRIFNEYITSLNTTMKNRNRHILLMMDNAPVHIVPTTLAHIKVVFLPSNTTCNTQALDAGIIKSFKANYRKLLINRLIQYVDDFDDLADVGAWIKRVDLKVACDWMVEAWKDM